MRGTAQVEQFEDKVRKARLHVQRRDIGQRILKIELPGRRKATEKIHGFSGRGHEDD